MEKIKTIFTNGQNLLNITSNFTLLENDTDLDGLADSADNCPFNFNPDQEDFENDGVGDTCDADDDNDNVVDVLDLCNLSILPELVPFISLLPNHFADLDGDGFFESVNPSDKTLVDDAISFNETFGCSCFEILTLKPSLDNGELGYGCTLGTLNVFRNLIGWRKG